MGQFGTCAKDSTSIQMLLLLSLHREDLPHGDHNRKGHSSQGQLRPERQCADHNSVDLRF